MLRVVLLADDRAGTADSVERLMGTKAEARFAFISDKAEFASEDLLDVRGGAVAVCGGRRSLPQRYYSTYSVPKKPIWRRFRPF
jgi:hypothetical protein